MSTNMQVLESAGSGALRCIPCLRKGHTCYAHRMINGEALCIYCVDDEPCFFELRGKKTAENETIPAKPETPRAKRTPIVALAERLIEDGLPEVDVQSALENQGVKPHHAKTAIAMSKETSVQTQITSKSPKTNGSVPLRECKCGCGGMVPAEFRFSYMKGHKPHVVKGRKKKAAKAFATVAPVALVAPLLATSSASREVGPDNLVAIRVSERQLNAFLVKLNFEEKQHLANYYLRNVDVA